MRDNASKHFSFFTIWNTLKCTIFAAYHACTFQREKLESTVLWPQGRVHFVRFESGMEMGWCWLLGCVEWVMAWRSTVVKCQYNISTYLSCMRASHMWKDGWCWLVVALVIVQKLYKHKWALAFMSFHTHHITYPWLAFHNTVCRATPMIISSEWWLEQCGFKKCVLCLWCQCHSQWVCLLVQWLTTVVSRICTQSAHHPLSFSCHTCTFPFIEHEECFGVQCGWNNPLFLSAHLFLMLSHWMPPETSRTVFWTQKGGKKKTKTKELHWPGLEPGSTAWQATILPLDHQCFI